MSRDRSTPPLAWDSGEAKSRTRRAPSRNRPFLEAQNLANRGLQTNSDRGPALSGGAAQPRRRPLRYCRLQRVPLAPAPTISERPHPRIGLLWLASPRQSLPQLPPVLDTARRG